MTDLLLTAVDTDSGSAARYREGGGLAGLAE